MNLHKRLCESTVAITVVGALSSYSWQAQSIPPRPSMRGGGGVTRQIEGFPQKGDTPPFPIRVCLFLGDPSKWSLSFWVRFETTKKTGTLKNRRTFPCLTYAQSSSRAALGGGGGSRVSEKVFPLRRWSNSSSRPRIITSRLATRDSRLRRDGSARTPGGWMEGAGDFDYGPKR